MKFISVSPVKAAAFTGDTLINFICDNVGDASPIVGRSKIGETGHLGPTEHIPKAEFNF